MPALCLRMAPQYLISQSNNIFSSPSYNDNGLTPNKMTSEENIMNNNCLCHIFDDNCTWIIILAIIVVFCCCCNH